MLEIVTTCASLSFFFYQNFIAASRHPLFEMLTCSPMHTGDDQVCVPSSVLLVWFLHLELWQSLNGAQITSIKNEGLGQLYVEYQDISIHNNGQVLIFYYN